MVREMIQGEMIGLLDEAKSTLALSTVCGLRRGEMAGLRKDNINPPGQGDLRRDAEVRETTLPFSMRSRPSSLCACRFRRGNSRTCPRSVFRDF